MRKLLYILIAVLLMPACVHQSKNGVRSLLEEAEGMMRTCPDTAYFLLREMETTMDWETEADSAYHGLLLLEAQTNYELAHLHYSGFIYLFEYKAII